jgi:FixJ family two-component response regulator
VKMHRGHLMRKMHADSLARLIEIAQKLTLSAETHHAPQ